MMGYIIAIIALIILIPIAFVLLAAGRRKPQRTGHIRKDEEKGASYAQPVDERPRPESVKKHQ